MSGEVRVVEEIGAPAARAWAVIRGFGDLMQWAEGLESCSVEGSGIGAVRTLAIPGGLKLQERLEAYDEAERRFSYAFVGKSPLPIRDYLATVSLRDLPGQRCEITWEGRFEPSPGSEAAMQQVLRGVYTRNIASLRKKLGA